MRKVRVFSLILFGLAIVFATPIVLAQDDTSTTVPDITGLSVPEAAAVLNQNGLALGAQVSEPWTESATFEPGAVSLQSLPAGQTVERGTAVDVTVLRSPNVLLLYDENVITLVNHTGGVLDLTTIVFTALDGTTPASFNSSSWLNTLSGNECVQLWAIPRTNSERPAECTTVQRWLSTTHAESHFWTGTNGVTRFQVSQGGIERAVCNAAAPGAGQQRCEFFVPADALGDDVTDYIYLAYTTDRLVVLNQSANRWMSTAATQVYNYNPNSSVSGAAVPIGDPSLFGNPPTVADIRRLAPGQCLFFTNSNPEATTPPQACDVIAQLNIGPDLIFWAADFEIAGTDGQRHICPAAVDGKLTVCIMPR